MLEVAKAKSRHPCIGTMVSLLGAPLYLPCFALPLTGPFFCSELGHVEPEAEELLRMPSVVDDAVVGTGAVCESDGFVKH